MNEELEETKKLHSKLSTYKNQEYPERLLQINNLRKKLDDLNELNKQELDSLNEVLNKERYNMKKENQTISNKIAEKVSGVSVLFKKKYQIF